MHLEGQETRSRRVRCARHIMRRSAPTKTEHLTQSGTCPSDDQLCVHKSDITQMLTEAVDLLINTACVSVHDFGKGRTSSRRVLTDRIALSCMTRRYELKDSQRWRLSPVRPRLG
jgi:hypothetical protein